MTADELTRRLYDAADDYEAEILDRVRDRAGITWECPAYEDRDAAPTWAAEPVRHPHAWTVPEGERCDLCAGTLADARARTSARA